MMNIFLLNFQILRTIAEPVYLKFHCSQTLNTEYDRRGQHWRDVLVCRARSLYCVYKMVRGINGEHRNALKVHKYNVKSNCFDAVTIIEGAEVSGSGIILQNDKFYILGGYDRDYLNSVSDKQI